jgi:hypothetical protein
MRDIYQPDHKKNWQTELRKLCQSYLDLLGKYPGLLEILLSMGAAGRGPAEVFEERFSAAIRPLSLEENLKKAALDLLVDYVHGFALAQQYAADDLRPELSEMEKPLDLYFCSLKFARKQN